MLSPSVNSNKKSDNRTKQGKVLKAETKALPVSIAHLNDSIGYENPHVLTHMKRALQATKDVQVKYELEHALSHAESIARHNIKLHKKLGMLPAVKKEFIKLNQNKSF